MLPIHAWALVVEKGLLHYRFPDKGKPRMIIIQILKLQKGV
jgi:hypothetical protein